MISKYCELNFDNSMYELMKYRFKKYLTVSENFVADIKSWQRDYSCKPFAVSIHL